MHAPSILALLTLFTMALSAAIPTPDTVSLAAADLVRKSEDKADEVDITQIGDGY